MLNLSLFGGGIDLRKNLNILKEDLL